MARSGQGYLGLLRRRRGLTDQELADLPGSSVQPALGYYPGVTGGPLGILDRPQAPFSLSPIQTPGMPSWQPTARPMAPNAGPRSALLAKPLPPALSMPQRQAPALAGPQAPDTMGGLLNSPDHVPGELGAAIPQGLLDAAQPQSIVGTPLEDPFTSQQPLDVGEMPPVEVKDKPYNAWDGMRQFPSYQPPNLPAEQAQPQPAQTHVNQQDGFGSPTALALLSAGLGILANNTGHYGQAGPAIGKGGLIGLNTFTTLQQQQIENDQAKAKMAMEQARNSAYLQQVQGQIMGQNRANQNDAMRQQLFEAFKSSSPEQRKAALENLAAFDKEGGKLIQMEMAKAKPVDIPTNPPEYDKEGKQLFRKVSMDQFGNILADYGKFSKQTGVNVDMRGETAFNSELGKAEGTQAAKVMDEAQRSYGSDATVNRILDYAKQWQKSGGQLGKLGNAQSLVTAWMQSAGVDPTILGLPADAGPAQALGAINKALVISKIGSVGFPANNFSDADRSFLEGMKPNLNDSPTGFVLKLMAEKSINRRSQEEDQMLQDTLSAFPKDRQQEAYREFKRKWRDYVQNAPAFTDTEKQEMQSLLQSMNQGNGGAKSSPGFSSRIGPNPAGKPWERKWQN